ncbi:hypothetical protein PM082_019875 [Marasmius tenuissimus]|nr:hypothetical protein PM082_019875 [Marasmius tenuissimus]
MTFEALIDCLGRLQDGGCLECWRSESRHKLDGRTGNQNLFMRGSLITFSEYRHQYQRLRTTVLDRARTWGPYDSHTLDSYL